MDSSFFRFYKYVIIVLFVLFILVSPALAAPKYASIIMDTDTGNVLYSRNADEIRYPASLTKIMALYLTFEALDRGDLTKDTLLPVSKDAASQPPSNIELQAGDFIDVDSAIKALVTKSANDVAVVIAEALNGTETEFARKMTEKARALGMKKTVFKNASGLHKQGQHTTARDMAILSSRIYSDFPHYYNYFSILYFSWRGKTYKNHNKLLGKFKGIDGIKTGYTKISGYNLSASIRKNGYHLIGIVMGGKTSQSRDTHMCYLFNKIFSSVDEKATETSSSALTRISYVYDTEISDTDTEGDTDYDNFPLKDISTHDNDWQIQTGAYSTFKFARNRLTLAAALADNLLAKDSAVIIPVLIGEKTLYRTRFTGLDMNTAHEACSLLTVQGFDCQTIPPGEW